MNSLEKALKSAKETRALQIGVNILNQVSAMFFTQFPGKKAIIVADTTTYGIAGKAVLDFLRNARIVCDEPVVFTDLDLYADYNYVEQLVLSLARTDAIPVAVGSGSINDLTKLASHRTNRSYLCVATAASMDGYTSFGASITYKGNKQTFTCPAPQAVLADIEIIRNAPTEMTASGYADLFAKIPAGADWILADELGIEAIEPTAWSIVQDGLHEALTHPDEVRSGSIEAISQLIEGLMLSGFAMQWSRTSRLASGAEHQFSHLWDMEHHTHNGKVPAHGFKVGIASLYMLALYEQMMNHPFEQLDIDSCCAKWLEWEHREARIKEMFVNTDYIEMALKETRAKYVTKKELKQQLTTLKMKWPVIRERLTQQLWRPAEAKHHLKLVGAPVEPEAIGISRKRLCGSFLRAQHLRRRFTILDVAVRTACLDMWLEQIFGAQNHYSSINKK